MTPQCNTVSNKIEKTNSLGCCGVDKRDPPPDSFGYNCSQFHLVILCGHIFHSRSFPPEVESDLSQISYFEERVYRVV